MKVIVLIMSIVMPPHVADIDRAKPMASADECWTQARKWTEHDLTDDLKAMGAIGFKASCAVINAPDEKKPEKPDDGSF